MLSQKYKDELGKLIDIANKYREGTISNSLFNDVLSSLPEYNKNVELCKNYIVEKGVCLESGDDEVEDIKDEANYVELIKPYDTTQIDISPKPLSLDMIIARLENDEIDLMPDFQRKSGLWSIVQKSQLIESLLLRIPLPAFYFDGSDNGRWIVIDGLQRLTVLKEFFVDKSLHLSGLEFLKDLEGAYFEDMPRSYIRRMKETQVITYIINPGAPINLKYNIFKRINTGGLELEPQEIRHALYQGFATKYLKELANSEDFKRATGYSIKTERMLDREFVLRFFSFFELGVNEYKGSIDLFLNTGMEYINKNYNEKYAENMQNIFFKVLYVNLEIFGKFAFRRMPDLNKRRPISKALFETWTTILAHYPQEDQNILIERKALLLEKYILMCSSDEEFIESIGSGKMSSVKRRFDKIKALVKEVIIQ